MSKVEKVSIALTPELMDAVRVAVESGDYASTSEAIREAVRENNRIARDRQQEIDSWKGDFSKREQERAVAACLELLEPGREAGP